MPLFKYECSAGHRPFYMLTFTSYIPMNTVMRVPIMRHLPSVWMAIIVGSYRFDLVHAHKGLRVLFYMKGEFWKIEFLAELFYPCQLIGILNAKPVIQHFCRKLDSALLQ